MFVDKEEAFRIHNLPKTMHIVCRQCEVTFVNAGVRKKRTEIPGLTIDEQVST